MGFCFSSPDKKQLLAESRELVENNARLLNVCVQLAEGDLRVRTQKAYDSVRYMIPTARAAATQVDKKINALCGDLKIALSKGSDRALAQADDLLGDLFAAIAERNSFSG